MHYKGMTRIPHRAAFCDHRRCISNQLYRLDPMSHDKMLHNALLSDVNNQFMPTRKANKCCKFMSSQWRLSQNVHCALKRIPAHVLHYRKCTLSHIPFHSAHPQPGNSLQVASNGGYHKNTYCALKRIPAHVLH